MNSFEMMASARSLAANPALGDIVTVRSGESGPTSESVDRTDFVMDALAHAVTEKTRSLEDAQTQLDSFFPGRGLSLAVHMERAKRQAELRRGY